MKVADSGMPDAEYWNSLFDVPQIVDWLAIPAGATVVEIGCGYGTFTVPVAALAGQVHTYDIEPAMIETTRQNLRAAGLENVSLGLRDVLEQGTGLPAASVDRVLLFNILHFSQRRILLTEAARILRPGGIAAIIHWRRDIPTPRGPAVELRPDGAQILAAIEGLHLVAHGSESILKPYHWGMQLIKEV